MTSRCIRTPGLRCVYGAPTYAQVREIVEPLLSQLLLSCPANLQPKSRGYSFRFRNPRWGSKEFSTLALVGVDVKRGDNLRGLHADEVWLDEVRDVRALRYIVEDVIVPQFIGRDNPVLGMVTTPPRTNDHEWVQYFRPKALGEGRYLEIPGSKNPDFTEADKQLILRAIGGDEDSIGYRREVECECISDPEDLIVPEFTMEKEHIVRHVLRKERTYYEADTGERYKLPRQYFPYVVMDTGYDPDFTAILFIYADFHRAKLVVVDEVFKRRMTLKEIASDVRKGVHKWFRASVHQTRYLADMEKRAVVDLRTEYKLPFRAVKKHDADAGLARARTAIRVHKVEILSTCVRLIDQLENGIWNENKTDFERTDANGHWDAGKALVYAVRMTNLHENPYIGDSRNYSDEFYSVPEPEKKGTLRMALGRKRG